MARRRQHDEHENHERWLVSYADFITLLFAFFVVMYSISSINEGKYKILSESLTGVFNQPDRSIKPIPVGEERPRTSEPDSTAMDMPTAAAAQMKRMWALSRVYIGSPAKRRLKIWAMPGGHAYVTVCEAPSAFLAGNDDDDDQCEDREKQPENSPSQRVAALHCCDHSANYCRDDAANSDENPLDAAEDKAGRDGVRTRQNHRVQHDRSFREGPPGNTRTKVTRNRVSTKPVRPKPNAQHCVWRWWVGNYPAG